MLFLNNLKQKKSKFRIVLQVTNSLKKKIKAKKIIFFD